jgi:RNA polymerase primary sigma factor
MKHQDMMDSLLSLGMQRGKLTCQELNDAFPAEFLPLDELERFLRLLDGLGVKVVVIQGQNERRKTRRSYS